MASYEIVLAERDLLRRTLKKLGLVDDAFYLTYRLPGMSLARITVPRNRVDWDIIAHELHHVKQFSTWWGPWLIPLAAVLFPLPILFSGRWWIERQAYLADIKAGRDTAEGAVTTLWRFYGWPYPKCLMRRWFTAQLNKGEK